MSRHHVNRKNKVFPLHIIPVIEIGGCRRAGFGLSGIVVGACVRFTAYILHHCVVFVAKMNGEALNR